MGLSFYHTPHSIAQTLLQNRHEEVLAALTTLKDKREPLPEHEQVNIFKPTCLFLQTYQCNNYFILL